MKILLTGADGQVGWELKRTLSTLGVLTAVTRRDADLADAGAVRRCIRGVEPDLIVNAAAYTAVDKAESEPALAHAVNAEAPAVMAEEARQLGAALVHYSTDYVFDGAKNDAYIEDDAPNPLNAYGRSKLAGEIAVRESQVPHLILRTGWVYGSRGKNFMQTVLRLAAHQDQLRIVDDQFGAPTWSRMLAEATAQILARTLLPHVRGHEKLAAVTGTYHLSAAGRTSWCGFANAILAAASGTGGAAAQLRAHSAAPISSAEYPTPAARPRNSILDGEKLSRVFGVALPDWAGALSMCLENGT